MENNISVVWGVTLAVFLARLKRNHYKVSRIKYDVNEKIKRFGIYYMFIDDLPL